MPRQLDRNQKKWAVIVKTSTLPGASHVPLKYASSKEDAESLSSKYPGALVELVPWGAEYKDEASGTWVSRPLKTIKTESMSLRRTQIAHTGQYASKEYIWHGELPDGFSFSDPEMDFMSDVILLGFNKYHLLIQEIARIILEEGLPPEVDPKKLLILQEWFSFVKFGYDFYP